MAQHLINGQLYDDGIPPVQTRPGVTQINYNLTTDYQLVMAENNMRMYGLFVNDSAVEIYVRFGNDDNAPGVPLTTMGSSFEMNLGANNVYTGEIYARSASTPCVLSVTEGWYAS